MIDRSDLILLNEIDVTFRFDIGDDIIVREHAGDEWAGRVIDRYFDEDCLAPHISPYWYVVDAAGEPPRFRRRRGNRVSEQEIKKRAG